MFGLQPLRHTPTLPKDQLLALWAGIGAFRPVMAGSWFGRSCPTPAIAPKREGALGRKKSGHLLRRQLLFDDLVGADEEGLWHGEAERLGGLEVDDHSELGRLHHRQIGGL
jgi:hypothetical protein